MSWDWGSFAVGIITACILAALAIILSFYSMARKLDRYPDTSNCPDIVDGLDNVDKPTPNK